MFLTRLEELLWCPVFDNAVSGTPRQQHDDTRSFQQHTSTSTKMAYLWRLSQSERYQHMKNSKTDLQKTHLTVIIKNDVKTVNNLGYFSYSRVASLGIQCVNQSRVNHCKSEWALHEYAEGWTTFMEYPKKIQR